MSKFERSLKVLAVVIGIGTLSACQSLNPNAPVAKQAKLALGHAYESQGKLELAMTLYQDLLRSGTGGAVVNEAAERAEALQAKLPILAPPAPMPTNAAAK